MRWHILNGPGWPRCGFPACRQAQREAAVQAWAQHAGGAGHRPARFEARRRSPGPLLLVANHISWLDIVVLHAAHHCRFVSKADVRTGP
jgi:1-acyl-sn-glycerol-3-phosphate acyltransferase